MLLGVVVGLQSIDNLNIFKVLNLKVLGLDSWVSLGGDGAELHNIIENYDTGLVQRGHTQTVVQ